MDAYEFYDSTQVAAALLNLLVNSNVDGGRQYPMRGKSHKRLFPFRATFSHFAAYGLVDDSRITIVQDLERSSVQPLARDRNPESPGDPTVVRLAPRRREMCSRCEIPCKMRIKEEDSAMWFSKGCSSSRMATTSEDGMQHHHTGSNFLSSRSEVHSLEHS